eukprot:SAG11_NODE_1859_length_4157_cov_6.963282_2_plen_53_part_00
MRAKQVLDQYTARKLEDLDACGDSKSAILQNLVRDMCSLDESPLEIGTVGVL